MSPDDAMLRSEQRHRSLLVALAQIVWTAGPRGEVCEDQPAWRAFTGQTREDFAREGWMAAIDPASREHAASAWTRAIAAELPFETEWRIRRHDGEYRCFWTHAVPARAPDGAIREWVGCNIDITDRNQREEELRQLHAQADGTLAQLERQSREMQILKNLSDTLQACNSRDEAYPFIALAASELFPHSSGALAVPSPATRELLETATGWGSDLAMKADFAVDDCWALRRGRMHEPATGTVCHHFQAGPAGPYACVPLAVRGEVSGLLSVRLADAEVIDDRRRSALNQLGNAVALGLSLLQLRERLQRTSIRDPLTGLAGAEFSAALLAREVAHAQRRGETLSVALLDLEGLASLTAARGSRIADGVLKEVGALLLAALRPCDLAARYDRHQLLLLLVPDGIAGPGETPAVLRLQDLCRAIQEHTYMHQGSALPPLTVAAGLAELPLDGTTPEALLRAAGQALRAARLAGSGRIETSSAAKQFV